MILWVNPNLFRTKLPTHVFEHNWAAPWENQQSAKAKTKAQISFAVTVKLISAFVFATRIVLFLLCLTPKFQASSCFLWLYRSVCVGPVRKPHCWFSHEAAHISAEKISEATRKYASLKAELELYTEHEHKPSTLHFRRRGSTAYKFFKDKENTDMSRTRKHHDLKLAFSEFYLSLILLQNYQTLNFTGFRKILKKHDKVILPQKLYISIWACARENQQFEFPTRSDTNRPVHLLKARGWKFWI